MNIKQVLILYKQSTFKHFFSSRSHENPFKNQPIAKRFIKTHEEHYKTLANVEHFFKTHDIGYSKLLRGRKADLSKYDLIVTVGGDGTFLEGAAQAKSQLMLGINSDPQWSVGRFCSANNQNFAKMVLNTLQGQHQTRTFNRMKISFSQRRAEVISLNDILVCHRNPAAMSRYYLQFRGQTEEQRSSGVWVATAAGSTGALRSAGGKVLPEESTDLQFVARELYCGKNGRASHRAAIFHAKEQLRITSLMKDGVVYVDGSHVCLPFPFGEKITIRKSSHPLKVVVA
jgi:NAD+ kinase